MGIIIDMKKYKREHDIALPRSPYYELNATDEQIEEALNTAAEYMNKPFDYRGMPPYAVIIGYENIKTGKTKLLKEIQIFPSKKSLETMAGIRGHYCIGLQQKDADKILEE